MIRSSDILVLHQL